MTLVILVRHAHSTANAEKILAGRAKGIHLTSVGRRQAQKLSRRLGDIEIKTLRSSPLIRCEETITPWINSRENSPTLRFDEDLAEVDYGMWTGRKLRALSKEPLWRTIQANPSRVTFPKGESMRNMQNRALNAVERALKSRGKGAILLVSHGDVLKSIVAGALNLHLDEFQRIVIDPASISILDYSGDRSRVLLLNDSHSRLQIPSLHGRGAQPLLGGGSGMKNKNSKVRS